jgi:hypothetical protein
MNELLRKKIEQRAYQLFLKRGGAHGYHIADWAKAEKEVLAEEAAGKKAPAVSASPVTTVKPTNNKKKPSAQMKR